MRVARVVRPVPSARGHASQVSRVSMDTLGHRCRLAATKCVRGVWRRDPSGVFGGGITLEGAKAQGSIQFAPGE